MRALQITAPGHAEVVTLPDAAAGPGDVVVHVAVAAICNTDRKLVRKGRHQGRVPGHEGAGRLDDGTPVGIHPDTGCGHCAACRKGWSNRCPDKQSIGIDRDGCLAEQVVVPAAHAVPLDGIDLDVAPLVEPLACCVHAADRAGALGGSGSAVVVGAGAMGILMAWVLEAQGWDVAICQRSEPRRALAHGLGFARVAGPDDPVWTAADAPELVAVTAPGESALRWALERVATGGTVHAFAGTPEGAPVDANLVHYRHLSLVGSTGSGLADYRHALDLVRSDHVPLRRLPARTTDLPGALAAVSRPAPDDALRTFVRPQGA